MNETITIYKIDYTAYTPYEANSYSDDYTHYLTEEDAQTAFNKLTKKTVSHDTEYIDFTLSKVEITKEGSTKTYISEKNF